jgi:hypothetical protein
MDDQIHFHYLLFILSFIRSTLITSQSKGEDQSSNVLIIICSQSNSGVYTIDIGDPCCATWPFEDKDQVIIISNDHNYSYIKWNSSSMRIWLLWLTLPTVNLLLPFLTHSFIHHLDPSVITRSFVKTSFIYYETVNK